MKLTIKLNPQAAEKLKEYLAERQAFINAAKKGKALEYMKAKKCP